jgi:hypothetical protein
MLLKTPIVQSETERSFVLFIDVFSVEQIWINSYLRFFSS